MDGVKLDSLITFKVMILAESNFCKEFYKCVTLYKDLLKQSDSTTSVTRQVSEVSSGRRGGSGSKKVEDRYYLKDKYSKISCEHKCELKKICKKRGSNSGGGGSSEPKSKIRKLAKQRKRDLRNIKNYQGEVQKN